MTADAAVRDARTQARDARQVWIKDLTTAWKRPSRDAAEPDAAERPLTEPDDPGERLRSHLRTEENDKAQAQRDATWKAYCDRLSNSWRADPRAATKIEQERQRWTHER